VPPAHVSPLALAKPTASNVILLLDEKLQQEEKLQLNPGPVSLVVSPKGLDSFLRCGVCGALVATHVPIS
jgi:hypothetical protein